MSEKYVTPPVISFEAIFEQSNPYSPIIFILSPGSDPASDLMKLAERSGFGGNKLKFLAMGQGQEKVSALVKLTLSLLKRPKAASRKWPIFPRAAKSGHEKRVQKNALYTLGKAVFVNTYCSIVKEA